MIPLSTRIASAKAEETAGLLNELCIVIRNSGRILDGRWWADYECLLSIDTSESLLAAAMMLTDKGLDIRRTTDGRGVVTFYPVNFTAPGKSATSWAATPALALAAAIAQSKGL